MHGIYFKGFFFFCFIAVTKKSSLTCCWWKHDIWKMIWHYISRTLKTLLSTDLIILLSQKVHYMHPKKKKSKTWVGEKNGSNAIYPHLHRMIQKYRSHYVGPPPFINHSNYLMCTALTETHHYVKRQFNHRLIHFPQNKTLPTAQVLKQ